MKVKLPAEEQDHLKRLAYITYESGTLLCDNRYVKSVFRFSMLRLPRLATSSRRSKIVVKTHVLGRPWYCYRLDEADSLADRKYPRFGAYVCRYRLQLGFLSRRWDLTITRLNRYKA